MQVSITKSTNNALWQIVDRVGRLAIGLLVTTAVARYLGPAQYGMIAFALALFVYVQAIATGGIDNITIRKISAQPDQSGIHLGSAFALRTLLSIVAASALSIWTYIDPTLSDQQKTVNFLVFSSSIFLSFDFLESWWNSQSKARSFAPKKLVAYIFGAGVRVMLIANFAPLTWFATAVLIESILVSVALVLSFTSDRSAPKISLSRANITSLLKESWPYMAGTVAVAAYMKLDQLVLSTITNTATLGIYAAIVPLSAAWNVIPTALASSSIPQLTKSLAMGKENFESDMRGLARKSLLLSFLPCGMAILFSEEIVNFLLGSKYAEYHHILAIHSLSNIFLFLGASQAPWYILNNKGNILLKKSILTATIALPLNILLVFKFGMIGAATSAIIVQAISGFIINRWLAPELYQIQLKSISFN